MSKTIPLRSRDGVVQAHAIVDDADYDWLNRWRWCLVTDGYARRRGTDGKEIKMHRQILGLEFGNPLQGDHINGDRLDNRRANLRVVTAYENTLNRRSNSGSTSRFRGVYWHTQSQRWRAAVKVKGHVIHLGHFKDEAEAGEAARLGRIEHLGEVAA